MNDDQNPEVLRWVDALKTATDVEINSRRIFKLFYPRLLNYLLRKGFSQQQAEDLAQETLMRVFQQITSFRGESTFSAWVFAIAANLIRNVRRGVTSLKRNVDEVSLEWLSSEGDSLDHIATGDDSPEQAASQKEQEVALKRAISQLPTKRRQCVRLQLRGWRLEEIAALLHIEPGTVKAHLAQARGQLRQVLSEKTDSRDKPVRPSGVSQEMDPDRPGGVSPKDRLEEGDR